MICLDKQLGVVLPRLAQKAASLSFDLSEGGQFWGSCHDALASNPSGVEMFVKADWNKLGLAICVSHCEAGLCYMYLSVELGALLL